MQTYINKMKILITCFLSSEAFVPIQLAKQIACFHIYTIDQCAACWAKSFDALALTKLSFVFNVFWVKSTITFSALVMVFL